MITRRVAVLLLLSLLSTNAIAENSWYNLGQNEEYISDFVILPNSVKEVAVKSNSKISITFRVDVSGEQEKTLMYGPFPIEMMDVESGKSLRSFYGGLDFVPVKGVIRVVFKNSGKKDYRILVVKLPTKKTNQPVHSDAPKGGA